MKNVNKMFVLAALAAIAIPSAAMAQEGDYTGTPGFRVHDRARGEISPDARAPTRDALMAAIDVSATSPSQLASLLEYGERVECHECIAPLQRVMLNPDRDPIVREMAAWWLRRRPFGFGAVMAETRQALATHTDPRVRAAAADAIGEFMDPHGVAHLGAALMNDSETSVRVAAVRGLSRINAASALPFLSTALRDANTAVQAAALANLLRVNFFRDQDALIPLLASDDAGVRRQAALVIGAYEVTAAVPALSAMVIGDQDLMVRQAAAWALGKVGTPEARSALNEALQSEASSRVRDAIEVAQRMR